VAGAAEQEEEDAVDVAILARVNEVREGEAERTGGEAADFEEVASLQAVAEAHALGTLEFEHDRALDRREVDGGLWSV
jgi:hypothetical protein